MPWQCMLDVSLFACCLSAEENVSCAWLSKSAPKTGLSSYRGAYRIASPYKGDEHSNHTLLAARPLRLWQFAAANGFSFVIGTIRLELTIIHTNETCAAATVP